jgi:hypothetical protein
VVSRRTSYRYCQRRNFLAVKENCQVESDGISHIEGNSMTDNEVDVLGKYVWALSQSAKSPGAEALTMPTQAPERTLIES